MSVFRLWAAAAAAVLVVTPALGQVNIGANFQSQKMTDNTSGSATPPDTTGSVGPGHFMQYNNGFQTFFNKDGSTAKTGQTQSDFWLAAGLTSPQASAAAGDPRLQFDPLSGRWFATCFTDGNNNSIYIARSDTANPTGAWKAVKFATTLGLFGDYPTLGFDANGVYIGTNNFDSNGNFIDVSIFSIPKANLLLTSPSLANLARFEGQSASTRGYTVQGVTNFNLGQSPTTAGLALAIATQFNSIVRTPINTPGATATLGSSSSVAVALPTVPPQDGAFQPNATGTGLSTIKLDVVDDRIQSRVYRVGNFIFVTSEIDSGSGRTAIHVTAINATTNAVLAETNLSEANFDYYIPSIAANARGDVVVGYTRSGFVSSGSSSNRWPSAYVSVGTLSGSTLTFGTPIELRTGNAEYLSQSFDPGIFNFPNTKRWGDYSATNVDPADPGIFWTVQEFAFAAQEWGTQASEVIPTVSGEKRWASVSASNAAGITGPFATAANWYNGVAPTATDHVIFSRNGDGSTPYTVSFAGSTSVDRASVRQGNVVWNVPPGAALNLTNAGTGDSDASGNVTSAASLAVADYLGTANLTVSGGGALNTKTTTVGAGLNGEGAGNVSSGSLTISGAGTTWANSLNAYVGGNATRAGGGGSLSVTGGATTSVAGSLVLYNRAAGLSANTVTVGTGSTLTASGLTNPGSGTVVPTVSLSAASSQLAISGGSGTTFGGTVSGLGSLAKSNAGSFTLTGANTYTGPTTISGGTLALSGSGSVAASPALTVGTGATLGVSGVTGGANFDATTGQFALASGQTLQGTGTANAGVTARPGSGVRGDVGAGTGTLTVAGTAVLQGAAGTGGATLTTVVSDNGTTTPAHSTLATTNLNLVIDGTNKFNLILAAGDNPLTPGQQDTVVVATATGAVRVNGVDQPANTVIDPSWYTLVPQGIALDSAHQLFVDPTGLKLELSFTPVPEPATVLALSAAGLGLAGAVRRKRRA